MTKQSQVHLVVGLHSNQKRCTKVFFLHIKPPLYPTLIDEGKKKLKDGDQLLGDPLILYSSFSPSVREGGRGAGEEGRK